MKLKYLKSTAALSVAAALAACGSSSNSTTSSSATNPMQATVPGVSSAVSYSFDLGQIDTTTGMYYVTDRTNKAVDAMNLGNFSVTLLKQAYAGCNSGGTSGGAANLVVPMPGCLTIAITANQSYVVNNDFSGPDGLDIVGPNLFVGDVNALWVVNKTTGKLVSKIAIPNSGPTGNIPAGSQGFRSDEGCYDPVNHLYATALTGDPRFAFYTILDTTAHDADPTGLTLPVVLGQVLTNDSTSNAAAGLEACVFDTGAGGTGFMYFNNDGTPTNGHGETDGIPVSDLLAMKNLGANKVVVMNGSTTGGTEVDGATVDVGFPVHGGATLTFANAACRLGDGSAGCGSAAVKVFPLPAKCDPTGIALGPTPQIGAMCRPGTFNLSMDFVIMDRTAATNATTTPTNIIKQVTGAGGGDQVAFANNKYYLANSRATPTGKSCFNGGTQVCNLTPKVCSVDATSFAVTCVDSGNNAHSVAAAAGSVVLPFTNTSAAGGGANFPGGGIAVYPTF